MSIAEWKCLCSQIPGTGHREEENCLIDPDSLSAECAAGPRFTLHLELPLFLWFRYCTMVEMQLFGLACKKNILALLTEFGRFTWNAARAGFVSWLCPAELRLWALQALGGTEQEYAGSTHSWCQHGQGPAGRVRAGLD